MKGNKTERSREGGERDRVRETARKREGEKETERGKK